jgi:hypothetical protein
LELADAMAARDDDFIDDLLKLGVVTVWQIDSARAAAGQVGVGAVDLLLAEGLIRPFDVLRAKATHFGAEGIELSQIQTPPGTNRQ